MCMVVVYVKRGLLFARNVPLGNSEMTLETLKCFQVTLFHSDFFLFISIYIPFLCKIFGAVSFNIDKVPQINPSANVLSLGTTMSVMRMDLDDKPDKFCCNISISNHPTWILEIVISFSWICFLWFI